MKTYLVGGAVRDTLLGRPVTERDWVVVGATPQQLLDRGFSQVGKDFPVFLHPDTKEEYALARTERKTSAGYTGFVCNASESVTLHEDLLRRDLTINAMAQDEDGTIIDPYGGLADLDNKLLRHVSDAFVEDPLRLFRVARFAARYAYLKFTIAPETMSVMRNIASSGELQALSAERVWQETKRSLMERSPEVFFRTLHQADALSYWFPEIEARIAQTPVLELLSECAQSEQSSLDISSRFAVLTSVLDEKACHSLCKRLTVSNETSTRAKLVIKTKSILTASENICAQDVLTLFDTCDVWRKPEQLRQVITALKAILPKQSNINHEQTNFLSKLESAMALATNINVQALIALGHKGAEIKTALNKQRLAEISTLFPPRKDN